MKDKTITARIDSDKFDRLSLLSKAMNRSKSFIFDNALDTYLDINEWQIDQTKLALDKATNPNTKWISQEEIEKEFL